MKQATLVLITRGDEVLLAMKKRGFGAGWWNGVGGKPNIGESIQVAAVRECEEEISVTPRNLKQVAKLNFEFPDKQSEWNQQVIVYTTKTWSGKPTESEEMSPKWFKFSEVPYDQMWSDDKYWLPQILAGKRIKGDFSFDESKALVKCSVEEL